MAGPSFFIKSLLRVANTQGPEVLTAIITGQFSTLTNSGGKQLTGVTAGGKSFSYTVPPGLEINKLMDACEEALEMYEGSDATEISVYLKRRPARTTVARFF